MRPVGDVDFVILYKDTKYTWCIILLIRYTNYPSKLQDHLTKAHQVSVECRGVMSPINVVILQSVAVCCQCNEWRCSMPVFANSPQIFTPHSKQCPLSIHKNNVCVLIPIDIAIDPQKFFLRLDKYIWDNWSNLKVEYTDRMAGRLGAGLNSVCLIVTFDVLYL